VVVIVEKSGGVSRSISTVTDILVRNGSHDMLDLSSASQITSYMHILYHERQTGQMEKLLFFDGHIFSFSLADDYGFLNSNTILYIALTRINETSTLFNPTRVFPKIISNKKSSSLIMDKIQSFWAPSHCGYQSNIIYCNNGKMWCFCYEGILQKIYACRNGF